MNKIRQSINRISCGLVMIGTTISPILLTSCDSNGIVFADYESYISENLIGTMHNKWGVDMMYYSTNEDVQAKFKNSYDVAIPSTYTVLDMIPQLAEYDWSKFDVKPNPYKLNNLVKPSGYPDPIWWGTYTDHKIPIDAKIEYAKPYTDLLYSTGKDKEEQIWLAETDYKNAWSLLTQTTNEIISYVDDYAHGDNVCNTRYYDDSKTILNYAIPYFLQDIMMAYHGDYISKLPAPEFSTEKNLNYQSDVNWSELTDVIAPKVWNKGAYDPNPNWDQRFQPINNNHLNMIDDSRTFYDICHIISDEQNKETEPKVNPDNNQLSIPSIKSIYSQFTNKFNANTIYLNSDSQQVLYPFANPQNPNDPDTLAQSNAAIFYSGDCLYAAMGSGIDAWADTWWSEPNSQTPHPDPDADPDSLTGGNFHIVKPKDSLVCMDMVVMNKKDVGSKKENHIYDAIRKVALEGCDADPTTSGIGNYSSSANDRSFEYGPMDNFCQVGYTSPLYSVDTYAARDESTDPDHSFFDSLYPDDPNKAELLAEINNINFTPGLLEEPLSNLTKSNMSFIYQEYKEKM